MIKNIFCWGLIYLILTTVLFICVAYVGDRKNKIEKISIKSRIDFIISGILIYIVGIFIVGIDLAIGPTPVSNPVPVITFFLLTVLNWILLSVMIKEKIRFKILFILLAMLIEYFILSGLIIVFPTQHGVISVDV